MILRRLLLILLVALAVLVGLFAASTLIAAVYYSPTYIWRVLAWRDADVRDYQKFPARQFQEFQAEFKFPAAPGEDTVRQAFQNILQIDDFDNFLAQQDTHAFIVIQNDAVQYEHYFNGAVRSSVVTSFSVAKSFTSALVGIAIHEGYIRSVDDPITLYLPEMALRDKRFEKITIRNLLMMSSGIKYVEFPFYNGDDALTYYYPNLRQLALFHTRIVGDPGERFLYNNYHPLLLGLILERATGKPVSGYLEQKIWKHIGMEYPASWSLDSAVDAFEKMESGINAHAIDFARFGRLYLHEGNWDGDQVVPAAWVAESTQEDTGLDRASYYPQQGVFASGLGYYKYMWWGLRRDNAPSDYYAAGNHGQYIYISPSRQLVIVRNGSSYGKDDLPWTAAFYQYASNLPAVHP